MTEDSDGEDESIDKPTSIDELPTTAYGAPDGVWYDEDGNVAGCVRGMKAPPEELSFDY